MCGLFFIFNKKQTAIKSNIILDMLKRIRHRGPDDEGILTLNMSRKELHLYGGNDTPQNVYNSNIYYTPQNKIALDLDINSSIIMAHKRLAIQDLSPASHQPLCDNTKRYWTCYNGEIYNFPEIRSELERRGHQCYTEGDTEVILKSYLEWGNACQEKFNGMWSILIWDSIKNELWISRDRMGVKPLYMYEDENFTIYTSEVKALIPLALSKLINWKPNIEEVRLSLIRGTDVTTLKTEFAHIQRFPSASSYRYSPFVSTPKLSKAIKFWSAPIVNMDTQTQPFNDKKAKEYSEQYYSLLKDAISVRLRADVNIGSALSGGIDSSSIVYIINEINREKNIKNRQFTFSNIYSDESLKSYNESRDIEVLVKKLNLHNRTNSPDEKCFKTKYTEKIYMRERCSLEASLQGDSVYTMPRKNNVTITLDGQGADELLGGYTSYWRNYTFSYPLRAYKDAFKTKSIPLSEYALFSFAGIFKSSILIRILRALYASHKNRYITKMWKISTFSIFRVLVKKQRPSSERLADTLRSNVENSLRTLLWEDDIDGMHHSVESRQPFIDYRLISFLVSIPDAYKMHNGWTKYIARLAFKDKLPSNIVWQKKKQGFPGPVETWLCENRLGYRDWADDVILSSKMIFNIKSIKDLAQIFNNNIALYIRLLVCSIWYDTFFTQLESSIKDEESS